MLNIASLVLPLPNLYIIMMTPGFYWYCTANDTYSENPY